MRSFKDFLKKNIKGAGTAGVLLGILMSKVITSFLGYDGQTVVILACIMIVFGLILYLIINKYFLGSLFFMLIVLPLIIGLIGMYLDNLYLMIGGTVLLIVMIPILMKVMSYIAEKKNRR